MSRWQARICHLKARGNGLGWTGCSRGRCNGTFTHSANHEIQHPTRSTCNYSHKLSRFDLCACFLLVAQDTAFSCTVTAIFLRPIVQVLGGVGSVRSVAQISLEKTKWLTLAGAGLAVVSSTALYVNLGLTIVLG